MKHSVGISSILQSGQTPRLGATCAAAMSLALPAIVEQLMVTAVQYVDTAMVGSLGSEATAAVGLTATTLWLIGGLLSAASTGFSVQVAHSVGAGELERARGIAAQGIKFIFIFGGIMGALALGVSSFLPGWLGADAQVAPLARQYFSIMACAVPFNLCALMISAVIRCSGDTKTPMLLNCCINIINVILNFLLIYPTRTLSLFGHTFSVWGADMGVAGAALGSLVSLATVSVLYFAVLYFKRSPVQQHVGERHPFERRVLAAAARLGLPVAFERSISNLAHILITRIIAGIGTAAIAADHLAITAESISYTSAYGVAAAATTIVGQSIGAKRPDLAKRFSYIVTCLGTAIMLLGGVVLFVFAPQLIRLFNDDPTVVALGAQVLRIVAFAEPFFAMAIVISGVLRGAGDTRGPFIITMATMWCVRVTLSFVLAPRLGLAGVWLAMSIELCVRGLLFLIRLLRGKWLNARAL